ncbi:hypothetical protein B566_EDAN001157 [Ephemera danica]|nr:hypothetical protein B566_EDAN001157 [Ephemera danica]
MLVYDQITSRVCRVRVGVDVDAAPLAFACLLVTSSHACVARACVAYKHCAHLQTGIILHTFVLLDTSVRDTVGTVATQGVVGVVIFYIGVMAVGIWAGNKQKEQSEEGVMLAGRNLGLVVGVFTLVATWVGAGFVSGIPEVVYTRGVVWCLVPVGYSLSFLVGGLFFAAPMRSAKYVTLMDPFQEAYGEQVGALLFLPALLGDVFWSAAILATLGDAQLSVLGSAVFVAAYTMLGGLYSVAYTDVVQLLCIILGMVMSVPFAWYHPAAWHRTSPEAADGGTQDDWLGKVHTSELVEWIDTLLLLVFGGIPWQEHWQNVASFGRNITEKEAAFVLPLVLRYLTPEWVSFIGLGAVSAAVMSSADSSFLAASALFSRNIYRVCLRPKATQAEVIWVLRMSVVVLAAIASYVALTSSSIYYLSTICSDLIYVLLFPQLLLTVYWRHSVHTSGCIASFFVGLIVRLSFGEPGVGLPSLLRYSGAHEGFTTLPRRTTSMLITLVTHIIISTLANLIQDWRDSRRTDVHYIG